MDTSARAEVTAVRTAVEALNHPAAELAILLDRGAESLSADAEKPPEPPRANDGSTS
jgi:hypothetical protein